MSLFKPSMMVEIETLRARVKVLEEVSRQALAVVRYALHWGPSNAPRFELEDVERNLSTALAKEGGGE